MDEILCLVVMILAGSAIALYVLGGIMVICQVMMEVFFPKEKRDE